MIKIVDDVNDVYSFLYMTMAVCCYVLYIRCSIIQTETFLLSFYSWCDSYYIRHEQ